MDVSVLSDMSFYSIGLIDRNIPISHNQTPSKPSSPWRNHGVLMSAKVFACMKHFTKPLHQLIFFSLP